MGQVYKVNGQEYRVLFPDILRDLTQAEETDLRESIKRYGVQHPIIVDDAHGIIDGANRARISQELSLENVPVECRIALSDEDKKQLALSLNTDRRNLSKQEREAAIQQRRERVAQARKEGKSYREIAAREGISHEQSRKDSQADAPVNQLTDASEVREERRAKEQELRTAGHTQREIAEQVGVSQATVSRDAKPAKKKKKREKVDEEFLHERLGTNRILNLCKEKEPVLLRTVWKVVSEDQRKVFLKELGFELAWSAASDEEKDQFMAERWQELSERLERTKCVS